MILSNIIFYLFSTFYSPAPAEITTGNSKRNYVETELTWQENRRLSWKDFAGKADDADPLHALTATNLDVKANCKDNKFNFQVRSVFIMNESWSKNKNSTKLLYHEQLHFDLTEVFARKLRKKLSEMSEPCEVANQKDLNPAINSVFDEWKTVQDLYDEECNHGLDYEKQEIWAKKIEEQLKELEDYKS